MVDHTSVSRLIGLHHNVSCTQSNSKSCFAFEMGPMKLQVVFIYDETNRVDILFRTSFEEPIHRRHVDIPSTPSTIV